MSAAFFIVLDQKDPGFDTMVNGKFLSRDSERLEKIAKSLGIRALHEYVSYSPDEAREMMEDMGIDVEDIEGIKPPEKVWYNAQEGLDLVGKLIAHISANLKAVKNPKGVLADLNEYQVVLKKAKEAGARWCLQVDM
jgi:hypothetical protein